MPSPETCRDVSVVNNTLKNATLNKSGFIKAADTTLSTEHLTTESRTRLKWHLNTLFADMLKEGIQISSLKDIDHLTPHIVSLQNGDAANIRKWLTGMLDANRGGFMLSTTDTGALKESGYFDQALKWNIFGGGASNSADNFPKSFYEDNGLNLSCTPTKVEVSKAQSPIVIRPDPSTGNTTIAEPIKKPERVITQEEKEKIALATEIQTILTTNDTMRGILFVKKHSTPEFFQKFMDTTISRALTNQYPWYFWPRFFLMDFSDFYKEYPNKFKNLPNVGQVSVANMSSKGGFPGKTLDQILAVVSLKDAIRGLSKEKQQAYTEYVKAGFRFYDTNKVEITRLIDEYHAIEEKQRKILKHPEMIALLREREEIRSAIYAKYDVQENKYDDAKDPGYRARRDKAGDESHKYDINTGWSKEEQLAKKLTNTPYATLSGDVVSKYIQPRLQKMPGYAEFQSEYRKIQQFNPDGPDKFTTNEPYSITDGRVHFLTVKSLHRWAGNPVRRALINSYIK